MMQQKQSAISNVKNFFTKKIKVKDKKNNVSVHPLLAKSSSLFDEKASDSLIRLSEPSATFTKSETSGQSLFSQLLANS